MIPLSDKHPTRHFPIVTVAIMAACIAVFFLLQPAGKTPLVEGDAEADNNFTFANAAIPCEITQGRPLSEDEVEDLFRLGDEDGCEPSGEDDPYSEGKHVYLAILFSMFMHGSLLHLGGNMLFLWIFGNNIEDTRGKVQYGVFYLIAGIIATLAHVFVQPDSVVPLVGASGAIAGVMGAYLIMFPNQPVRSLIFLGFFVTFAELRAKWFLMFWFFSQFFINPNEGIAWVAHVGGFVVGALAGLLWRTTRPKPEVPAWGPTY